MTPSRYVNVLCPLSARNILINLEEQGRNSHLLADDKSQTNQSGEQKNVLRQSQLLPLHEQTSVHSQAYENIGSDQENPF